MFAKPCASHWGSVENFELLCRLPVASRSQNFVGYFTLVANYFLQRKSVRIQLLGQAQQFLRIESVQRLFPDELSVSAPRRSRTGKGTSLGSHAKLLSLNWPTLRQDSDRDSRSVDDFQDKRSVSGSPTHNLRCLHRILQGNLVSA
jgi:hypothetical protein